MDTKREEQTVARMKQSAILFTYHMVNYRRVLVADATYFSTVTLCFTHSTLAMRYGTISGPGCGIATSTPATSFPKSLACNPRRPVTAPGPFRIYAPSFASTVKTPPSTLSSPQGQIAVDYNPKVL
jgi:hypothetical protein